MSRRDRRRRQALARKGDRAGTSRVRVSNHTMLRVSGTAPDRRVLLLGTALASTLLLATIAAPSQVRAQTTTDCTADPGVPIFDINNGAAITCINVLPRTGNAGSDFAAINLETDGGAETIFLDSEGRLRSSNAGGNAYGIRTVTDGVGSSITIKNRGDIDPVISAGGDAFGINARTRDVDSPIDIKNSGDFRVEATGGDDTSAYGIRGSTGGDNSPIDIHNSGDFWVEATGGNDTEAIGIRGLATGYNGGSPITIVNSGDFWVEATGGETTRAWGFYVEASRLDSPITIKNSGDLWVEVTGGRSSVAYGFDAFSGGVQGQPVGNRPIAIHNSGDITVTATGVDGPYGDARGIDTGTQSDGSRIDIHNSGHITATAGDDARGIRTSIRGDNSPTAIHNSGDITVTAGDEATGIDAETDYNFFSGSIAANSDITIHNSGDITASAGGEALGIIADAYGPNSPVSIWNTGDLKMISGSGEYTRGIRVITRKDFSPVKVKNTGDMKVEATGFGNDADAIEAETKGNDSSVTVHNSGDGWVKTEGEFATADGIDTDTEGDRSSIKIVNSGDFDVTARGNYFSGADGIDADTDGDKSRIDVSNSGDLWVETRGDRASADGIDAYAVDRNSPVTIRNSGDVWVKTGGDNSGADGIDGGTQDDKSGVDIHNSGNLWVETLGDGSDAEGLDASTNGDGSPIKITNSGDVHAEAKGESIATGIEATAYGPNSPIDIHNSGSVYAAGGYRNVGVYSFSPYANKTTIWNTGSIGAQSHLAIDVDGAGTAKINNAGIITGFVDLTDQDDVFNNQSGGVFEAKKTSLFGGGDDLFYNFASGTVQAATDFKKSEKTFFEGLETFKNAGTISMVDGRVGDSFTISNTPGGTDLKYKAMPGATLAVDSFLGGPGSRSDIFTVEGDVSGTTKVAVSNTNTGPGVFNSTGIPVVFVDGATPSAGNFKLQDGPIDTGFFDYDLFFVPTNSGFWELRSFAGGGAHLLPQLLTAAQDIWHQSSSTWFDRTADLRVLMQDGPAPADLGGKSLAAPVQEQLTPAVWLKAGGSWLDRDADASTRAYGRNYNFNLDRELETIDVQVGIDFGTRDVFGSGDALVFGMLGGFVHGDLDYDSLARRFQYDGGQVGVYATYLSGGLFVDTLLNAHIYELDANNVAFPGSIDGNTVGLRTDAGYRFGSFSGGVFLEPLGTIEVMWADLDGFALGGNRVSFDDEANVRGRLGLRAGTTSQVWEGTLMEPFIIGSVWGNLSDDNSATLVSTGRTFRFQDDPEDVWGEVSAGVNFFNFTQTTSVFGKVDVQFGDDLTGVGGKAGMRVAW